MKRALYALGAIALGLLLVTGCRRDLAANGVRVTDVVLQDWKNPEDGKTYLVVAPTWTNEGPDEVRRVLIYAALQGPTGNYPNDKTPETVNPFLEYRGDPVEAGTTIRPSDHPDTFIVMGEKEAVLAETGPDPKAEAFVWGASKELDGA